MGDFEHLFSHYPSRIAIDGDIVSITEAGRIILEGAYYPVKFEDVSPCLFPDLEEFILKGLLSGSQSIGAIKQKAEDELQATPGQTDFHLQWLYKHGAVRFKKSAQKADNR